MTITLIAVAAVFFAFMGWAVVRGGAISEQQSLREVVFAGVYEDEQ